MATRKLSLADQIARAKKHLADLEAKEKAGKFDTALAKHKNAINAIYADMKAASGKQRGIDSAILTALAEAMGMRGMTITKKVQQRKPK
jgi:hypothetical protein